jgi:putative flippase GtrA
MSLSARWRPVRFACTGCAAAAVQLVLLESLTDAHWSIVAADILSLLVSTQVNFVLSYLITWGDRRHVGIRLNGVLRRWAGYQGMVAVGLAVNMMVFLVARTDLQFLVASALGTAAGAGLNYVAGDHIVFAARA